MKRELTLDEIEAQDAKQPIWVINSSADNKRTHGITGEVVLYIPIPDSQPEEIVLPATWLPFNLTDHVPRRHLLATPVLRRYAQSKLIKFITVEYARRLLKTDGADEERLDIEKREVSLREAGTAKTLADTPVNALVGEAARNINPMTAAAMMAGGRMQIPGAAEPSDGRRKVAPEIPDYEDEGEAGEPVRASTAGLITQSVGKLQAQISPAFKTWAVGIEQKTDVQVLNGLRTNGNKFTRVDLEYLLASGKLAGKPKTIQSVSKALAK